MVCFIKREKMYLILILICMMVHLIIISSFATIFSVFTLIDFATSQWIWLFLLLFFGIISMIEFDRILKLNKMNLLTRFFILMVISNGLKLMQVFDFLQPKIKPI